MPIKPINAAETVLGYTLKERIGMGGYGEVWSAEAPGGFSKAIKFIHGYMAATCGGGAHIEH